MRQSPLASLFEYTPELADEVLRLLPLRSLAVLSATCAFLRTAVQRQPESQWLARTSKAPPWHPMRQAPCAHAFHQQQQRLHAGIRGGQLSQAHMPVVPFCGSTVSVLHALLHAPPMAMHAEQPVLGRSPQTAATW